MCREKVEAGDIFRRYGNMYRDKYGFRMSANQLRAMRAIEICRTAELGGHIDKCDNCGRNRNSYNSCRNRHCPKCQSLPTERWLLARKNELLPIHYFHVVFTLPAQLNSLIYSNQKIGYSILFKAASQTLLELTKDPQHLGAQIGITAILHTWGQKILFHPHIHCLITGGGLTKDNEKWITTHKNFLIHVNILSEIFRGKFIYYLKKAFNEENIRFNTSNHHLNIPKNFKNFIDLLYTHNWVVYCKDPLKNPNAVIEYFGRYTHRVAISNYRIIKIKNDKVHFKWKDYKDNNKIKILPVYATEFIRRFLLHILPHKFVKIRYYGMLANCHRNVKLKICLKLLKCLNSKTQANKKMDWKELLFAITGRNVDICPFCKKGRMILIEVIPPLHNHSPPHWRYVA